jgi:DNA excision repair protein ERCC-2
MSGTLAPLQDYQNIIGLVDNTDRASFSNVFPEKNRKVIYTDSMTTVYEELKRDRTMIDKIGDTIVNVCNGIDKNTAVFFPSFELMNSITQHIIYGKGKIGKDVYVEERAMPQQMLSQLIQRFKSGDRKNSRTGNAVLFSVIGGRISEGIDFPAEQLELIIIVGIPYPKPTARQKALEYYYDMKFKKGWEYAIFYPTIRKLLQTIGRLIRSEDDRGIVLILDKRAPRFRAYIKNLSMSNDVMTDVKKFFTTND